MEQAGSNITKIYKRKRHQTFSPPHKTYRPTSFKTTFLNMDQYNEYFKPYLTVSASHLAKYEILIL